VTIARVVEILEVVLERQETLDFTLRQLFNKFARLERVLHKPSASVIIPNLAKANTECNRSQSEMDSQTFDMYFCDAIYTAIKPDFKEKIENSLSLNALKHLDKVLEIHKQLEGLVDGIKKKDRLLDTLVKGVKSKATVDLEALAKRATGTQRKVLKDMEERAREQHDSVAEAMIEVKEALSKADAMQASAGNIIAYNTKSKGTNRKR